MRLTLLAGLAILNCASAMAAAAPPPELGALIGNARYVDVAVSRVLTEIRRYVPEGQALRVDDVDAWDAEQLAERRAQFAARYLKSDLDGDGALTPVEIAKALELAERQLLTSGAIIEHYKPTQLADVTAADTNGDGKVDFSEIMAAAAIDAGRYQGSSSVQPFIRTLLTLDPNGDGELTLAEAEQLVRTGFAQIDTDGSQSISRDEYAIYNALIRPAAESQTRNDDVARRMAGCRWPSLPRGAEVAAVLIQGGAALSTVALAGQDRITSASVVTIAPGDQPLFLLLSASEPTLWKLEGEVSRVQGVALASPRRGNPAGVFGAPAGRVEMLPAGACYVEIAGVNAKREMEDVWLAMSRMLTAAGAGKVSVQQTREPLYRIELPDGSVATRPATPLKADPGFTQELWDRFMSNWPGGIVRVDATYVAPQASAEPYDVWPAGAGFLQLIKEGFLEPWPRGQYRVIYQALKPTNRLPAMGERGISFIVQPSSFPLPLFDKRQYCIISAETKEALAGPENCALGFSRVDPSGR